MTVTRQVCETKTICVPRTICKQVPVEVCVKVPVLGPLRAAVAAVRRSASPQSVRGLAAVRAARARHPACDPATRSTRCSGAVPPVLIRLPGRLRRSTNHDRPRTRSVGQLDTNVSSRERTVADGRFVVIGLPAWRSACYARRVSLTRMQGQRHRDAPPATISRSRRGPERGRRRGERWLS